MIPHSISGYPRGADADTIGALILASNCVLHKSGVAGTRTGYFNFNGITTHPAVSVFGMFILSGEIYGVNVEAGVLKLRRYALNTATQVSTDILCRNTTSYRKVFDDMLDTFKVQEGKAVQINCFPPVTTDGITTVESGAPRCREISLYSEVYGSTLIGASAGIRIGLKPGERVVTRGAFILKSETMKGLIEGD